MAREIAAKTLLRRSAVVDPWFLGRYGMNLYRGCAHGCAYCDGRAERYHVVGDFATDLVVKVNARELAERELRRAREPGFVLLGGGVCDAYQPLEAEYRLARSVLEVVLALGFPVHVLTKSALIERDLDLLAEIQRRARAIFSVSIQTLDETVREQFEPGAAPIAERLRLLRVAKDRGLATGAMAMPVLPGISDPPAAIEALVAALADAGVDFVCFGGLTLRPGVQKQTYLEVIRARHPDLVDGYARAYRSELASGIPDPRYLARVDARFREALARHGLPSRAPRHLYRGLMPRYADAGVWLEHRGFGRCGYALQRWAARRVTELGRRRGFHHGQVEAEFDALRRASALREATGISPGADAALRTGWDLSRD